MNSELKRKLMIPATAMLLLCALCLPAMAKGELTPMEPSTLEEEPLRGSPVRTGVTPQSPGLAANLRWESATGLAAWDAAENAVSYNVMLLRAGETGSTVMLEGITATAAELGRLMREQGAGSYSFRVQGVSADNLPGMWSTPCGEYLTPSLCFVSLPYGAGLVASAVQDSFSPVQSGESFRFRIDLNEGYFRSDAFAVAANGAVLKPDADGVYTIENISADTAITCTGILAGAQIPAVPEIGTASLPAGRMGSEYKVQLTTKDKADGRWSAVGTLPPGLTLSDRGLLSGTPTRRGVYAFTVRVENSVGTGTKSYTIDVSGKHYDSDTTEEPVWIRGSEDTLCFKAKAKLCGIAVDDQEPELPCAGVELSGKTAVLSPAYLKNLTIGEHTLLLIFADGDGERRFSIEQADPSQPPAMTVQPVDTEGAAGGKASFNIRAEGTLPLLCCWQEERDGEWIAIPGANSATLTLTDLHPEQDGRRYRCVVTNGVGQAESESAALTVTGEYPLQPGEQRVSPVLVVSAITLAALSGGGIWLWKRWKKEKTEGKTI